MVEILRTTEGDNSPLKVAAHPITRVACDAEGIVFYERYDAEPIRLNAVSPKRSRQEALRRCVALLDALPGEQAMERDFPISASGRGLSYNQLKQQTFEVCKRSQDIEGERRQELNEKRSRRR